MCKVSVIVPVYKVEKYIDKCLDSLVKQSLDDIEIIIVNDGSPDKSEVVINKYMDKYNNIKYYKKSNGGLSSARNYGLRYAKGEYVVFIDSDDYVSYNMLEIMYNKVKSNDYDMAICSLDYVNEDGNVLNKVIMNGDKYSGNEIKKFMINMYPVAWNKMYKRSLFDNDIYFKEGIWYEDVEFNYRMIPYVKSIIVCKDILYHYVQRPNAITKTFDKRLYDYIDNWNGIIKFYKDRNLDEEYYKEIEYSYVRYLYATFIWQATNYRDYNEYKKAVDMAIKNVHEIYPKYYKNKYFYKSIKGVYLLLFNRLIGKLLYKIRKIYK